MNEYSSSGSATGFIERLNSQTFLMLSLVLRPASFELVHISAKAQVLPLLGGLIKFITRTSRIY